MKQLIFHSNRFSGLEIFRAKAGMIEANVVSFRFWNSCFRPFASRGHPKGGGAVTKTKKIQAKKVLQQHIKLPNVRSLNCDLPG
jgi:hypothetical protein